MGTETQSILLEQLKQTCKLAGARWAVWLHKTGEAWGYDLEFGLTRTRREALNRFLSQSGTSAWLAGAMAGGRTRSRRAGDLREELGCARVYVFSKPQAADAILTGGDDLPAGFQSFFRVLALNTPQCEDFPQRGDTELYQQYPQTHTGDEPLVLLHKLVEQIAGLTCSDELARVTAELWAEYFGYELVAVLLAEANSEQLVLRGVGGRLAQNLQIGFNVPASTGAIGGVYHSGKSYTTNRFTQATFGFPIPGWQAGSEICVSLSNGDHPLGVVVIQREREMIDVEKELRLVELLAAILTSSLLSDSRYHELLSEVEKLGLGENRLVGNSLGEG